MIKANTLFLLTVNVEELTNVWWELVGLGGGEKTVLPSACNVFKKAYMPQVC